MDPPQLSLIVQPSSPSLMKNLKNLESELGNYVKAILSCMCARSDERHPFFYNKLPILTESTSPEVQFILQVGEAIFRIPYAKDLRKIQDFRLSDLVLAFTKETGSKISIIHNENKVLEDFIDIFVKMTSLPTENYKEKLGEINLKYQNLKSEMDTYIEINFAKISVLLDARINAGTKVNTTPASYELLEAACDCTKEDFENEISIFCEDTKRFIELKNSLIKQKEKKEFECAQFETSFNKLVRLIENTYLPVIINTTLFSLGYPFGLFNNLSTHSNLTQPIETLNKISPFKIKIDKLTESDESFLIKIFELAVNKYQMKKDACDIPITLFPKNSVLIQLVYWINSWKPCTNYRRKKENDLLLEDLKNLNSKIESLSQTINTYTKDILNKITVLSSQQQPLPINIKERDVYQQQVAVEIDPPKTTFLEDRNKYCKAAEMTIPDINKTKNSLTERVIKRLEPKKATVSQETLSLVSHTFDITETDLLKYIETYHKNTLSIQEIWDKIAADITLMDAANVYYQKKYSFLRYLQEEKNGTKTHFSGWYKLGSYNFFYSDSIPK